jgi:hypothetical protein
MRLARSRATLVATLLAAHLAGAPARASDWLSYRDAYRTMVVFEKYGGAKNLIQIQLQVEPTEKGVASDGLQLLLNGKSTQLNLPLDPTGRTVFPLLKSAYDENATLVLSHKAGRFAIRPRVTVVVRPDGVYEAADLRAACGQALDYGRYADPSLRAGQCVAVRFVFARKTGEAIVRLRMRDGGEAVLPVVEGAAFAGDNDNGFRTVTYRFAGTDKGQVVTQNAPLAIAPLFE